MPVAINERRADRAQPAGDAHNVAQSARAGIEITVHHQLDAVEPEWRQFEQSADCTAFQTFDWLSAWCRHIGVLTRTQPAIVVGRRDGATLFILPLGVTPGAVRRLTWLGSDLCDYNGPLLANAMTSQVAPDQFRDLWREIRRQLQSDSRTRHDLVELTKMPEQVGAQANPFLALSAGLNPSNAYVADLFGTWTEYLRNQAILLDPPARPQQAQAARRNRRGAFRDAAGSRRDRAFRGPADRAEGGFVRAHGRRQHVRAAGLE